MHDLIEFGLPASAANISCSPWAMYVEQTSFSEGNLILKGSSAPWILDAAKKLDAISRLPTGWDSYGGASLDLNAKRLTVNALGWLDQVNLPVPAVVLGAGGTVQLEWSANGKELEIGLDKDGIEFLQVHEDGTTEEGAEKSDLPQNLSRKLRGLTWWFLHG